MQGNAKSFLKAVLLGLGLALLALGTALAMTPAGTQIQNQASASYIDSAGQPRITLSNLAITVVQQVYGLTITPNGSQTSPGQTKVAPPGADVFFSYLVTNTGNGTDTINLSIVQSTSDNFDLLSPTIYRDANCNGNLDAGENTPITNVTLGAGQQACVIVKGTIPATAANNQRGDLNLVGALAGSSSVTDNDNWAQALASTQAIITASKRASPAGSVTPGSTITYTISGANVGSRSAGTVRIYDETSDTYRSGIFIEDTIPNGLTVTELSGSNNLNHGTIRFFWYDGRGWRSLGTGSVVSNLSITGNGSRKVGMLIEGGINFFVGANYTFSFQARVPTSATPGTVYNNFAIVHFNTGSADVAVFSNTVSNVVASNYNVAVGPYQYPEGGASGTYDVGFYTVTRSGDRQTIALAGSGAEVFFRHTLRNTGGANDSFTLSFSGAPPGWACFLVFDDLITPISGPVGPVAPNGTLDFALKCHVPATFTSITPTTLTVTATSVNDPTKSDSTTDVVSRVGVSSGVDLARRGKAGNNDPSDDNFDTPQSADPGQVVYFPIDVFNAGVLSDFFNLTANAPTGWTVTFYPDANCDGVMDNPTPSPVTNTGLIGAEQTKCFIAAVQVPAGAAPGLYNLEFTAAHRTEPGVTDTISATVEVNFVPQITLAPDRFGTVTSPGTIEYTHTLTNNSNAELYCRVRGNGGSHGWTYEYSTDGNTWSPALSNVAVAANGGTQTIHVKLTTPSGQPIGLTDANIVRARCFRTYPPDPDAATPDAQATVTVYTTIAGGDLRMTKSAQTYQSDGTTLRDPDGATAFPDDVIEYTVVAENVGTANLTNVRISDPIPAFTNFVSVSVTITGFPGGSRVLYSTNGTSWSTSAPSSVPTGGVLYVAVDTNNDGNITDADIMPAGARITITLRVRVR